MDLNYKTAWSRLKRAGERGLLGDSQEDKSPPQTVPQIEYPELPSSSMETPELIEHLKRRTQKNIEAARARDWMEFKINIDGPFALAAIGDPHMDDGACNFILLDEHMRLLTEEEYLFGLGMGDYTNNWSARLAQLLSPHQEVTRDHAWQLCNWFFGKQKLNGDSVWLLLLKGNHDAFSNRHGTGDPLDWMARGPAPLQDWEAKFKLKFKNGNSVKIWASHHFAGTSIYNQLHGNLRKAKFTGFESDLYISADKHNWALYQAEDQEQGGKVSWLARARGYKFVDDYAMKLGYGDQKYGASIGIVIDPDETGPRKMHCFADLWETVDFLRFKRRNRKS